MFRPRVRAPYNHDMPKIIADEECVLCLGSGWQTEPPVVTGKNEDGSDILSEPRISMCRCAFCDDREGDEEDEDIDYDDDDDDPPFPWGYGNSLVLAH